MSNIQFFFSSENFDNKREASPTLGQHANNNSNQASSVHVMSRSGSSGTEKKRQAPTPSPAQVKYMGSVSPVSTSPPLTIPKPTNHPPPPPSKSGAVPPLAPKPDLKKL